MREERHGRARPHRSSCSATDPALSTSLYRLTDDTAMPVQDLPKIIAHRGNAAEFPENTLQALESAVDLGLKHVEFDVQLTADNVPVVFHDSTLDRVADRPDSVHELTWAQLAEIPVGEMQRFGPRFAYTYPPSLAQTVDAIAG